jgi:hypothetical protein
MRAFVFTDKALARHAGRFVWLSIDTEREENAAFVEKYPIEAWPTLMVLDPRTGAAALKWMGSATVPQLEKLLEDGERAVRGDGSGLEGQLALADKLNAEQKQAEAEALLRKLVAEAPADWSRRPRAVESLLFSLLEQHKLEDCARLAMAELPRLPRSASSANLAANGLACALMSPKDAPWRKEAASRLEADARAALAPPAIDMAADDRSGVYSALVEARDDAGDEAGKKKLAAEWLAFLEGEISRAPTAEARTVFDSHLLGACLALGEPARAIPYLEASERALPDDYNPPARLAVVYQRPSRLDEALAANTRALGKVYGPRKLRVLSLRSDLLLAQGDKAGAKQALEDALQHARSLPPAQVPKPLLESLEKKSQKLR